MGISFGTNRRRNTTPATYYHHHPPPPEYYAPYPAHPPLPPHAFPAAPPPLYCPHYQSYNGCNYTSSFVGGTPSFGPFHNGLPASSQVVAPPPPPPPYVEDQHAKKVRSDVNVHKDTLRLEVDEMNPDYHLVSFLFDAMFDGR